MNVLIRYLDYRYQTRLVGKKKRKTKKKKKAFFESAFTRERG